MKVLLILFITVCMASTERVLRRRSYRSYGVSTSSSYTYIKAYNTVVVRPALVAMDVYVSP